MKIIKKTALIIILLSTSITMHAWELDVEVDSKTSTKYRDCQEYADDIVELVKLFIKADNDDDKLFIDTNVKFLKKYLKSCEKTNNKNRRTETVKIGIKHNFDK